MSPPGENSPYPLPKGDEEGITSDDPYPEEGGGREGRYLTSTGDFLLLLF